MVENEAAADLSRTGWPMTLHKRLLYINNGFCSYGHNAIGSGMMVIVFF